MLPTTIYESSRDIQNTRDKTRDIWTQSQTYELTNLRTNSAFDVGAPPKKGFLTNT